MRSLRAVVLLALSLLLVARSAEAQRRRRPILQRAEPVGRSLDLRGSYDFDLERGTLGVGLVLPSGGRRGVGAGMIMPSLDVARRGGDTHWQLNLDLAARAPRGALYGGIGLAVLNRPTDPIVGDATRLGFNVVTGLRAPRRRPVQPFAEFRWTIWRGDDPLRLMGGLAIGL